MRLFSFVLLTFFAFASALFAQDAKVHVVGVYEGNTETQGRIHDPEVHVRVDQTEAPVVLALTSHQAVRWRIEAAPGASIEQVYVGGYDGKTSDVYINGTLSERMILEGNTFSYRAEGKPFRTLVTSLTTQLGVDRLASFSGAYRPEPGQVLVVDKPSQAIQLQPDYLGELVRPDALPEEWKAVLMTPPTRMVRFSDDGFLMRVDDRNDVKIPVSLEVPRVSWPMGAAFDAARNRIYGVSAGGEGYLYQYDMVAEAWSVLTGMDHRDSSGMLFDEKQDRLIIGAPNYRTPSFLVYNLTGSFIEVELDHSALIGYFDLYDIGNGPPVPLLPIAVEGDMLLAKAGNTESYRGHGSSQASRTYVINMKTGSATLVDYQEAPKL